MDKKIAPTFEKWVETIKSEVSMMSDWELNMFVEKLSMMSYFNEYDNLIKFIETEIDNRLHL